MQFSKNGFFFVHIILHRYLDMCLTNITIQETKFIVYNRFTIVLPLFLPLFEPFFFANLCSYMLVILFSQKCNFVLNISGYCVFVWNVFLNLHKTNFWIFTEHIFEFCDIFRQILPFTFYILYFTFYILHFFETNHGFSWNLFRIFIFFTKCLTNFHLILSLNILQFCTGLECYSSNYYEFSLIINYCYKLL